MRQGVADGVAESAEARGVQEHVHLVAHADGTVVQIAVVKAEARIDEQLLQVGFFGALYFEDEIFVHEVYRVGIEVEIAGFADVAALNVADNDGGIEVAREPVKLGGVFGAGEINNAGAGLEAAARDA